jgi:hypothetical protein
LVLLLLIISDLEDSEFSSSESEKSEVPKEGLTKYAEYQDARLQAAVDQFWEDLAEVGISYSEQWHKELNIYREVILLLYEDIDRGTLKNAFMRSFAKADPTGWTKKGIN